MLTSKHMTGMGNILKSDMPTYEAVIGLEVHVQIRTNSKMFTRVAAGYGQPENTLTDPVVLALPGALPVMNKKALDAVIKAGLMLNCEIASVCKWDRKNYFYPDSPKNYQISQYDQPICVGGEVEIELPVLRMHTISLFSCLRAMPPLLEKMARCSPVVNASALQLRAH